LKKSFHDAKLKIMSIFEIFAGTRKDGFCTFFHGHSSNKHKKRQITRNKAKPFFRPGKKIPDMI